MNKHIINHNFTHHPPTPEQVKQYETIRSSGRILALTIDANCPGSPEKTTAIRKIEEAVMWANASIARNQPDDQPASE